MERVNINLPEDVRRDLRELARSSNRREGELVRELLIAAIAAARRERFFARVAAAQTEERRHRDVEVAEALFGIGHGSAR